MPISASSSGRPGVSTLRSASQCHYVIVSDQAGDGNPRVEREEQRRESSVNSDELRDVTMEIDNGLAWITMNRPERYNALRGRSWDELIWCFKKAWGDSSVGVVALTGAGDRAFSAGGDMKQAQETGDFGRRSSASWRPSTSSA